MRDYIEVNANEVLTFRQSQEPNNQICFRWGWYDQNDVLIDRRHNLGYQTLVWIVPKNVAKLRVSYPSDQEVKLERGSKNTPYVPNPTDDLLGSFPHYSGISLLGGDKPTDFKKWRPTNEYSKYLLNEKVDKEETIEIYQQIKALSEQIQGQGGAS